MCTLITYNTDETCLIGCFVRVCICLVNTNTNIGTVRQGKPITCSIRSQMSKRGSFGRPGYHQYAIYLTLLDMLICQLNTFGRRRRETRVIAMISIKIGANTTNQKMDIFIGT